MIISHQFIQDLVACFFTFFREKKRWKASRVKNCGGIRVFYGYESLLSTREIASGGMVKTQDLKNAFPNTSREPNLLYLISSALPPCALRMAQCAKKAGAKIVLNQNGVAYPAWYGNGWKTANRFMREVFQQADYVFYQSNFCKLSADRYLEIRCGSNEILYNPVDTSFFCPPSSVLPLSSIRLLVAGSHNHFYRVKSAIDTLRFLLNSGLDARLEIAGRFCWTTDVSNAENQIRQYLEKHSLSKDVTISGRYTQEQSRLMLQRAHILIHPQYNDSCPRLVVEAMASGLPVVFSASGGTPELVGGEAGVGVQAPVDWEKNHPPSAESLANATKKILADYHRYSTAARHRATMLFDVKPWIERHRDVFIRLIEKGKI